ncbi:hypothetical protein OCU04_007716 [Sclerotinia nivalis]|uniref:F-box domain-containing protein n=1 Tax=Sclerotinia nivalis TaxID=352851 RepID=A0A9X0AJC9_9HELO|nr:hypothetical protein OCU04_007716 [Sclerotinia nivalis]
MSQGQPPIFKLPNELLTQIASEASLSSAACLALCNKKLKVLLGEAGEGGEEYFERLRKIQKSGTNEILAFLSYLEKDLPPDEYFICQSCIRIHPISSVKWPGRQSPFEKHHNCTRKYVHPYDKQWWWTSQISFPQVQLAMMQYRHINRFPLDAFKCLKIQYSGYHNLSSCERITLLSTDAQIVTSKPHSPTIKIEETRSELVIRSQLWTLLPRCRRDNFVEKLPYTSFYPICRHLGLTRFPAFILPLKPKHLANVQMQKIRMCCECWTDYVIDAVDYGESGMAIRITKWQNLGAGLDIKDEKWRRYMGYWGFGCGWKSRIPPFRNGSLSPHQQFEEGTAKSILQFTSENEQKLFSKEQISRLSSVILLDSPTPDADLFTSEELESLKGPMVCRPNHVAASRAFIDYQFNNNGKFLGCDHHWK